MDIDKTIDIAKLKPNDRVALKNDSYVLHLVLDRPTDTEEDVDELVSR